MRCRKIQRTIADQSLENGRDEESDAMNRHLRECRACARFLEEYGRVRTLARDCPPLALPEELDNRTRTLCLALLRGGQAEAVLFADARRPQTRSGFVYAGLAALVGLTFAFMAPLIRDFKPEQPFTVPTVIGLILTIQNVAMLFFAPLVLHRHRTAVSKTDFAREA